MRPVISYCVTCGNRLEHLKGTLPHNIHVQRGLPVEFVILDFNSTEPVHDYFSKELLNVLQPGKTDIPRVRWFRYENDEVKFSHALAKNLCAARANGDIVCNLDTDNFLIEGFTELLLREIPVNGGVFAAPSFGSFFGRVAMARDEFDRVGGYDTDFSGYGYEDTDLVSRLLMLGLVQVVIPETHKVRICHELGYSDSNLERPEAETVEENRKLFSLKKLERENDLNKCILSDGSWQLELGNVTEQ